MNNEILSYFNLHSLPFSKEIKTDELEIFPSFKSIFDSLKMLINSRGIGVITGKSGSGKSCLIRNLISSLNPGLYKPFYICHSSVTLTEFYRHLAVSLGLEPMARKDSMFRVIKMRVLALNKSNRVHPVFFIDEAHLLRNDILQELRLLCNFDIDSFNAMTIILCGQPSLNLKFGLTILESLANSIILNLSVDGLREEETFSYIENRIARSGNSSPLFTKNAMKAIHQASGGILRTINTIANASLIKVYQLKTQQVEAEHVNIVISR